MQRATQSRQKPVVWASSASGSARSGASSWLGRQVSTNGIRSPAVTRKAAVWAMSRPVRVTGVSSHNESGPATAQIRPSRRRTQGRIEP